MLNRKPSNKIKFDGWEWEGGDNLATKLYEAAARVVVAELLQRKFHIAIVKEGDKDFAYVDLGPFQAKVRLRNRLNMMDERTPMGEARPKYVEDGWNY